MTLCRRAVLGGMTAAFGIGLTGCAPPGSIRLAGGCNGDNTQFREGYYPVKAPRNELLALFHRSLEAAGGSSMNVELFETDDPGIKAYAQYLDRRRTVILNSGVVSQQLGMSGGDMRLVALLMHEIAHLILNHVFGDELRDKWSEAAADRFAGMVAARMSADPEENWDYLDRATTIYEGMAHGGKYATPSRRKNFFYLGALDQVPVIRMIKAYTSATILHISRPGFQVWSGVGPGLAKFLSPQTHAEIVRLGTLGEIFLTNARHCALSDTAGLGVEFGVGFSRSGQTRYRTVEVALPLDVFVGQRITRDDYIQMQHMRLHTREYRDPAELFFNEAFDYKLLRDQAFDPLESSCLL